jgi:hypothetical protein
MPLYFYTPKPIRCTTRKSVSASQLLESWIRTKDDGGGEEKNLFPLREQNHDIPVFKATI